MSSYKLLLAILENYTPALCQNLTLKSSIRSWFDWSTSMAGLYTNCTMLVLVYYVELNCHTIDLCANMEEVWEVGLID